MLRQEAGLGTNFLQLSVAEWLAYWAAILVAWVQDTSDHWSDDAKLFPHE